MDFACELRAAECAARLAEPRLPVHFAVYALLCASQTCAPISSGQRQRARSQRECVRTCVAKWAGKGHRHLGPGFFRRSLGAGFSLSHCMRRWLQHAHFSCGVIQSDRQEARRLQRRRREMVEIMGGSGVRVCQYSTQKQQKKGSLEAVISKQQLKNSRSTSTCDNLQLFIIYIGLRS